MKYLTLFEIPVYYRTLEQYKKYWQNKKRDYINLIFEYRRTKPTSEEIKKEGIFFDSRYKYTWYFNDIIAWIYIDCHDYHITARMKSKKRSNGKIFEDDKKLNYYEVHTDSNMSSYEIARELVKLIDITQNYFKKSRNRRKNWYIQREIFDNLVFHIDWAEIIL